jgi:Uma2 family endonuclease
MNIVVATDLPEIYEDDGYDDMGDSAPHSDAIQILFFGIKAHLARQPQFQVFTNLNVYYHPTKPQAYFSPDVMVITPRSRLENAKSYRIDADNPPPMLVIEVLSPRTAQQGDLAVKPVIYGKLGIPEYLLVDPQGLFLETAIAMRKLQADGSWHDTLDEDGGVSSDLGFRVIHDDDGELRVLNAATGQRYVRPGEAEVEAMARRRAEELQRQEEQARLRAEEALRQVEAELARLKALLPPDAKQ